MGAAAALALGLGLSAPQAQAETVLRVVPHSGLKILDPIWTTAYISRNHGYMIYDTLFAMNTAGRRKTQKVGHGSPPAEPRGGALDPWARERAVGGKREKYWGRRIF